MRLEPTIPTSLDHSNSLCLSLPQPPVRFLSQPVSQVFNGCVPYTLQQTTADETTQLIIGPQAFNGFGNSPCAIANSLGQLCFTSCKSRKKYELFNLIFWKFHRVAFTIPALPASNTYEGPSLSSGNSCTCSSVYYILLSACAVCQQAAVSRYSLSLNKTMFMLKAHLS